ncbi:16S rRNA (guanine(966)-N(2))-methyltransferase RsmD [soil metagenome]
MKGKPAAKQKARSGPPQQVRIIGGQWKRTPLAVLDADGLRPTPDRVRETVFNWLRHLFDDEWEQIHCLDLFAGTGALGFEAASRGATQVLMVEENATACRQLEAMRDKLQAQQLRIQRGDALSIAQGLAAGTQRFQLIFLDPPYHQDWLARIFPLCERLLAEGGIMYVESEMPIENQSDQDPEPEWMTPWQVLRAGKAGMVCFHLLRLRNEA